MKYHVERYLILIILILVCGYLLYQANVEIEMKTIDQVNNEQIVHARQAEYNLNLVFDNYNNTLFFLTGRGDIISLDDDGKELMREYYRTHQADISSITWINNQGIVEYSYPNESVTGADISSQTHVAEILQTHEKVISDVFTAIQGYRSVAFHVPLFSGGQYEGSLGILIPFDTLARKSLERVSVMDTGYAYAVSSGGTILYSPHPNQTGRSVQEIFAGYPSVLSFISEAQKREEGRGMYWYSPPENTGSPVPYHAVYKRIDIGDQTWHVIIATPEAEIFRPLQTFTRNIAIVSAFVLITLLFLAYLSVKAFTIVREEEKRRVIESALRESEKNYRLIFESIQDVFYRTDREGNLVMMSPSGLSLFGYDSLDEIIGVNVATTFYHNPEDRENLVELLQKDGAVRNYEITFRKKNGGILYGQTSSHLYYDDEDRYMGIEGIIHDITNEKMTGAALQQALKKLNLLNSVTFNDIQSSLFCLSGYLELGRSLITDERQKETIEKEEQITRGIMDSLNFARDYQGLGVKPPAWQNVGQTFLYGISHSDLCACSRTMDIAGIEIFADPLLEKVFFILADNVTRHGMNATGIRVVHQITDNGLLLIFEDNGVGIPAGEKERIFERGFGPQKGKGLFLAREILGITGISIQETGTAGTGARFEILVPPGSYRISDTPGRSPGP